MTILKQTRHDAETPRRLSMAEIFESATEGPQPLRFTAFDGSATGPEDAPCGLHLKSPRGAAYLATAPGDLGLARAYISGELDLVGAHPATPTRSSQPWATCGAAAAPGRRTLAPAARPIGPDLAAPASPGGPATVAAAGRGAAPLEDP